MNFVTPFFVDNESIARVIGVASRQRKKPIVCNSHDGQEKFARIEAILKEGASRATPSPERRPGPWRPDKYGEIRRQRARKGGGRFGWDWTEEGPKRS